MAIVAATLLRLGRDSLKKADLIPLNLLGLLKRLLNRATKAPSYSSPCFKKLKDFQINSSQTLVAMNKEIAETIPYPPF